MGSIVSAVLAFLATPGGQQILVAVITGLLGLFAGKKLGDGEGGLDFSKILDVFKKED